MVYNDPSTIGEIMFKNLKSTNHEIDLNVNVSANRFFKSVTTTVLETAIILVVAHAVIAVVDSKFNTTN